MVSTKKAQSLKPVNMGMVLFRSALAVVSLCFAFLSFSMLPLVETYVLLFCTPLFISILAIIFLGERVAFIRWIAIITGLIGVVTVLRPTLSSIDIGHLFGLLAAAGGAGAAIISRKIGSQENAATLMMFPLIFNIILTGSMLYFVYKPMALIDLALMFLIGSLALFGQLLILFAYRMSPANIIAPTQYSQIIWAIIFGTLFFNESIDKFVIIGSIITVGSGLLILIREKQVSNTQPNLNTRNTRMVMAALIKSRGAGKQRKTDSTDQN